MRGESIERARGQGQASCPFSLLVRPSRDAIEYAEGTERTPGGWKGGLPARGSAGSRNEQVRDGTEEGRKVADKSSGSGEECWDMAFVIRSNSVGIHQWGIRPILLEMKGGFR